METLDANTIKVAKIKCKKIKSPELILRHHEIKVANHPDCNPQSEFSVGGMECV